MSEATIRAAIGAAITAASALAADRVRWGRQGVVAARPSTPGAWISMLELGEDSVGRPYVKYALNSFAMVTKLVEAVTVGAPGLLTTTAHDLHTGDGPVRVTTSGTAPGGLEVGTPYWVIRVDQNRLRLAPSFLAAIETPAPVAITDVGVGEHKLVATDDTLRAGAELTATTQGAGQRTISVQCYGGDAVDDASPLSILRRVRAALELPTIRGALHTGAVGLLAAGKPRDVSLAVTPARFEPRAVMEIQFYVSAPAIAEAATLIENVSVPLTVIP